MAGTDGSIFAVGDCTATSYAPTAQVAARGATSLELYVDGANTRARALYERTGYAERTRDVQYLTLSRPPRGGVTIGA